MNFTEQETKILRSCHKILDYKLGTIEQQVEALERQIKVMDAVREREGQRVLDKTRIISHLKKGEEFKIDLTNDYEVELFVRLRDDGLVNILEPERKKFIAKWKGELI